LTSYAVSANRGLVAQLPGGLETFLDAVQFMVLTASVAGLFHFMPNTHVRWRHALLGALFVAAGLTLAKLGLAWWLQRVPTYATLYGAFATLPIFLIWIYLGWVIVLLGALLAANAPGLLQGLIQRAPGPGMEFGLSLGVVRELWARQRRGAAGATALALAQQLRVDPLQLAPVLEGLQALDWVGRLEESGAQRLVLLRNPTETLAAPLIQRCLAPRSRELARLWLQSQWENRPLADLL
jgi:membrane protein